MSATPRQIALLRASLPHLRANAALLSDSFCCHLFRYAPTLRADWSLTAMSRSRRIIETVLEAAALIETPDRARMTVSLLAHDLRGYGLGPRDYVALHAAMMDMLADTLTHGTEIEAAVADALGAVLALMLADAHGPRARARTTMPLAA